MLTLKDMLKVIRLINNNYPNAYIFDDERTIELATYWLDNLKVFPKALVLTAINNAIKKNKFAPNLACIIEEVTLLQDSVEPTDSALWEELLDALPKVREYTKLHDSRESNPYSKVLGREATDEEVEWACECALMGIYNKLNIDLKAFIPSWRILSHYTYLTETDLSYERNRFFKQLPSIRKARRSVQYLSENTLQLVRQACLCLPQAENELPTASKHTETKKPLERKRKPYTTQEVDNILHTSWTVEEINEMNKRLSENLSTRWWEK